MRHKGCGGPILQDPDDYGMEMVVTGEASFFSYAPVVYCGKCKERITDPAKQAYLNFEEQDDESNREEHSG